MCFECCFSPKKVNFCCISIETFSSNLQFVAFLPQSLSECEDSNYTESADYTAEGFTGTLLLVDKNALIHFTQF